MSSRSWVVQIGWSVTWHVEVVNLTGMEGDCTAVERTRFMGGFESPTLRS